MMTTVDASSAPGRALPGPRSAIVLAIWFALVLAANLADVVRPATPQGLPLGLAAAIAFPPALFYLAYRTSSAMHDFVLALDLRLLTAVQAWRVLGGMFVAFHAQRMLPGLFAYPAGYGDMLVGVLAVPALLALVDQRAGWRRRLVTLNVLGLIDFAGAVGTGVLASEGPLGLLRGEIPTMLLQQLPVSLIPTFAVPLWIIIHLASLLQLRRLAVTERRRGAAAPAMG